MILFSLIVTAFIILWFYYDFKNEETFKNFIKNMELLTGKDLSDGYENNLFTSIIISIFLFWLVIIQFLMYGKK
jgi:hypothetical protein